MLIYIFYNFFNFSASAHCTRRFICICRYGMFHSYISKTENSNETWTNTKQIIEHGFCFLIFFKRSLLFFSMTVYTLYTVPKAG